MKDHLYSFKTLKAYLDCSRSDPVEECPDSALLQLGVGYENPAGEVAKETQNHRPSQDVGKCRLGHTLYFLRYTESKHSFCRSRRLKCHEASNVSPGFL